MAALNLPKSATYEVHETVKVDTTDFEDHTFCGIMFPIKAKAVLPVEKIVIRSVAVRGQLGPLTVWVTKPAAPKKNNNSARGGANGTASSAAAAGRGGATASTATSAEARDYNFRLTARHWIKVYEQTHAPSHRNYQKLDLKDHPVELYPGQVRAIYIHSTLQGDEAIVYDNSFRQPTTRVAQSGNRPRYEDAMLSVCSGKAHLSPVPFGQTPIWGWGNAWRDHREFVGQLEYGALYKLWNPTLQPQFGGNFQKAVRTLLLSQRRTESPVAMLPDECLYYILNMCRWDWFQDAESHMHTHYKKRKRLRRQKQAAAALKRQQQQQRKAAKRSKKTIAMPNTNSETTCSSTDTSTTATSSSSTAASVAEHRMCTRAAAASAAASAVTHLKEASAKTDDDDDIDDGDKKRHAEPMEETLRSQDDSQILYDAEEEDGNLEEDDDDDEFEDAQQDVAAKQQQQEEEDDEDDDDDEIVIAEVDAEGGWAHELVRQQVMNAADPASDEEAGSEDESEWERANGYRADPSSLQFRDVSSEDEDADDDDDAMHTDEDQPAWFRRHFARFHLLRALGAAGAEAAAAEQQPPQQQQQQPGEQS